MSDSPGFEGVQIETADITLYELFFETVLQAQRVQTMEHPQVDRLRGYCYRDVLIVVRQDLKSARPTGWVQITFLLAGSENATIANVRPSGDSAT